LGVASGINRSRIPWECGAGHSFLTKLSRQLVFSVFPFPPCTVQYSGNEKNFRQNRVKLSLAPCLNIWWVFTVLSYHTVVFFLLVLWLKEKKRMINVKRKTE